VKYLLRTKSTWEEDGYCEWSPGRNKWYPISQVKIEPEEIRHQLIFKVFPKIHSTRKAIAIDGFYSQARKILQINKVVSKHDDLKAVEWIAREDNLGEEILMFFEDLWAIGELDDGGEEDGLG